MSERIKIIPQHGFRVLDPIGFAEIPVEGRVVVNSLYWKRMIKQGVVKIATNEEDEE